MDIRKKIFLGTVISPIVILVAVGCFTTDKYFFYAYKCSSLSFYILHSLTIFGSIYLIYLNSKSSTTKLAWYLMGGFVLVATLLNIFLLYSFSNFGF